MRLIGWCLAIALVAAAAGCRDVAAAHDASTAGTSDAGIEDAGGSVDAASGFPVIPTEPVPESQLVATLAGFWCQYREACKCSGFTDYDSCFERYEADLGLYRSIAQAEGLTYDPDCVAAILGRIGAQASCGEVLSQLVIEEFRCTCPIFHGARAQGEPCTSLAPSYAATTCAKGLQCFQAHCAQDGDCQQGGRCQSGSCEVPTCAPLCNPGSGLGGPCDPEGTRLCMPGTLCSDGHTCEALPGVGEACHPFGCWSEEAYCDRTTNTCVPAKARGEACSDAVGCQSLNCVGGVCSSSCISTPF